MENIGKGYDYVGWVPCVSGNLMFDYAECGLAKSDKHIYAEICHVEFDDKTKKELRNIIISSTVNWQDGNTEDEGNFRVVLISSGEVLANHLDGYVYIIPHSNKEWVKYEIEADLQDIKRLSISKKDIATSLKAFKDKLDSFQAENYFLVNFKLMSNGFTFLRYDKNSKSKSPELLPETSRVLARQSYYYVKYTFHKHSHHDKSAESLTTTYPVPQNNQDIGMLLFNGLKQSLVRLKRDSGASDYKKLLQVKGIVSYTKSLLVSCEKEGFISHKNYTTEKSYIENLGDSLDSSGKKIEALLAAKERISANYRSLILFSVTVVAPITIIFQSNIKEKIGANMPIAIINIISYSAQHIFILIAALVFIYWQHSSIALKFGSHNFAFDKLRKAIEFIVESKRSARIIGYLLALFALFILYVALTVHIE